MSRNYAQIATAIWRNDEFRDLSVEAQHLYLQLTSQPDISAAGVLSLNVQRWASRAKNSNRRTVIAALEELQAGRFVFYDLDTEELLVRSFVRWDGGYGNPRRLPVIERAARDVEAPILRRALAAEFARLGFPDGWGGLPLIQDAKPDNDTFSQVNSLSNSLSAGLSDGVSPSDGVVVSTGSTEDTTTHNPQPPAQPDAEPPTKAPRNGTRLPEDWEADAKLIAWAKGRYPRVDLDEATLKFKNYWHSKTGKDATKRDWPKTFQNWVMEENRRLPRWPENGRDAPSTAPKAIPVDRRCDKHPSFPAATCGPCRSDRLAAARTGQGVD